MMDTKYLLALIARAHPQMEIPRDADINDLLGIIAHAHAKMMAAGQWDWVVRADAALALTPRSRSGPPETPPSATTAA
jgi:hypothetical protein